MDEMKHERPLAFITVGQGMFHLNFTEKNSKFRRTMVPVDVSFKFGG
jgi:hypothetical protein